MASVLGIIFENTKHGPEDYTKLQGENDANFIDGQMAGGNSAFKMLAFMKSTLGIRNTEWVGCLTTMSGQKLHKA